MASDSQYVRSRGTSMAPHAKTLPRPSRPKSDDQSGLIDMKHRRWIDQVLAESQSRSVTLPWARGPKTNPAGSARKNPQDLS